MKVTVALIVFVCLIALGVIIFCMNLPFGRSIGVTFSVVDDRGTPVPEARIKGYFNDPRKSNDAGTHYDVLTNDRGVCKVKGVGYSFTECTVKKMGYYSSRYHLRLKENDKSVSKLTVVLKKIRNPISMKVRNIDFDLPSKEQYYPFDLDIGDLVEPYGKGKKANIYIYYYGQHKDIFTGESSFRIKVSDSNQGLKLMSFDDYSQFKTVYDAPVNAYTNQLEFQSKRTKTERLVDSKIKKNEYIVFKCQNSTNEKMYNYGKILPDLSYWPQEDQTVKVKFTYYYNPIPNDRNLEFNPEKNLIKTVDFRGKDNSDRFKP